MTFERGNIVMIVADRTHEGIDGPFFAYIDGWLGRVAGNNHGLIDVRCATDREALGYQHLNVADIESLPLQFLIPANELRLIRQ